MTTNFSRRSLIKGVAALAGAAAASGKGGLIRSAWAQSATPSAVVVIHLTGGYNSLFAGADPFVTYNHFGVTASNVKSLGNGLVVDAGSLGSLSTDALSHMATIGVYHRFSGHDSAPRAEWSNGSRSYALMLAAAMGGTAPIRCAVVGGNFPAGPRPEENGVSMQKITDMSPIIASLGGVTTDTTVPARDTGAQVLMTARAMGANPFAQSPNSLVSVKQGYDAAIAMLTAPAQSFDYPSLATAYGLSAGTTVVSNFASQMLAAELMIRAGCKVVIAVRSGDWDTHGSNPATGERDRNAMAAIIAPLRTFMARTMAPTSGLNVTTAIIGDFARSLPASDHANFVSATVVGPRVMVGTTGRPIATRGSASTPTDGGSTVYNDSCSIDPNTPNVPGFWSYLSTVASSPANPFGANPHALVLP